MKQRVLEPQHRSCWAVLWGGNGDVHRSRWAALWGGNGDVPVHGRVLPGWVLCGCEHSALRSCSWPCAGCYNGEQACVSVSSGLVCHFGDLRPK